MSLKLRLRNKIRRSRAAGGFVGLLDQPFATGATAASTNSDNLSSQSISDGDVITCSTKLTGVTVQPLYFTDISLSGGSTIIF